MIPAAVLTRLGPWLTRAGSAAMTSVKAALGKNGVVVNSVSDVVAYAKTSPGNAMLVFSNLAMAGFAVSDLFSPADKASGEVRAAATSLAMAEAAAANLRLIEIGQDSESLGGISGNKQDLVTLRRILQWARGHYGSAESVIEAHKAQQAFFELSLDDVRSGFELLDI